MKRSNRYILLFLLLALLAQFIIVVSLPAVLLEKKPVVTGDGSMHTITKDIPAVSSLFLSDDVDVILEAGNPQIRISGDSNLHSHYDWEIEQDVLHIRRVTSDKLDPSIPVTITVALPEVLPKSVAS